MANRREDKRTKEDYKRENREYLNDVTGVVTYEDDRREHYDWKESHENIITEGKHDVNFSHCNGKNRQVLLMVMFQLCL